MMRPRESAAVPCGILRWLSFSSCWPSVNGWTENCSMSSLQRISATLESCSGFIVSFPSPIKAIARAAPHFYLHSFQGVHTASASRGWAMFSRIFCCNTDGYCLNAIQRAQTFIVKRFCYFQKSTIFWDGRSGGVKGRIKSSWWWMMN